jgi:hypothetical protein
MAFPPVCRRKARTGCSVAIQEKKSLENFAVAPSSFCGAFLFPDEKFR